jgi:hypothetical protein
MKVTMFRDFVTASIPLTELVELFDMYIFPENGRSMFLQTGGIHVPHCTHDHTINSHRSESQIADSFISLCIAAWRTRSDCSVSIVDVSSREKFLTSLGIELQFSIFHIHVYCTGWNIFLVCIQKRWLDLKPLVYSRGPYVVRASCLILVWLAVS